MGHSQSGPGGTVTAEGGAGPYADRVSISAERDGQAPRRRVPTQERSRRRVADLLEAAADLVVEGGVEAVTTRSIADRAGVPVASLYQYFADKEDVLMALVERDMAEMEQQVAEDLAQLDDFSIDKVVDVTMRAYVKVYQRRRAFVEIWLRGRTNPTIAAYGRALHERIAGGVRDTARYTENMNERRMSPKILLLAVDLGDRVMQLAFADDDQGDMEYIDEGITMISAYLQRHAVRMERAVNNQADQTLTHDSEN